MRHSAPIAILTLTLLSLTELSYAEEGTPLARVATADTTGALATEVADKNSPIWTQAKLDALKNAHRRQEALLQAQISAKGGSVEASQKPTPKKPPKPAATNQHDDFSTFQKQYLREINYHAETVPVAPKPPPNDACNPQRFFIRSDSLDNYLYGITPASKAKGASISYTDDLQKSLQTLTINGMMSYVVARDLCPPTPGNDVPFISAYSIAPFINAQGNLTEPQAKTERSALKYGAEAQLELSQFIFPRQVFTVAPYYQTDFRGIARVDGVSSYWDVYDPNLHLGGYISTPLEPYLGWFLQLRGETDIRQVSNPGLTSLTKSEYAWTGGTARLNLFFFPLATNIPEFLRNRFSFIATVGVFHDAYSGQNIQKYTAALAYKITTDGSSSISLEYDKGTDKDTLTVLNQYLVKLTYAY